MEVMQPYAGIMQPPPLETQLPESAADDYEIDRRFKVPRRGPGVHLGIDRKVQTSPRVRRCGNWKPGSGDGPALEALG